MKECWTASQVCKMAGVTYKRLDYWARKGWLKPSVAQAGGTGTLRLYNKEDVLLLGWVVRMLDQGFALWYVRDMAEEMRQKVAKGGIGSSMELWSDRSYVDEIDWLPPADPNVLGRDRLAAQEES